MEIFWVIIIIFIVWSIASDNKDAAAPDVRFRMHKHKHPDGSTVLKHKHDAPPGTNWHRHDVDGTVIPTYEDGSPISPAPVAQQPVQKPVRDPGWHAHGSTYDSSIFWHSHPEIPGYSSHYHRDSDGAAVGDNPDPQDVRDMYNKYYSAEVLRIQRDDER